MHNATFTQSHHRTTTVTINVGQSERLHIPINHKQMESTIVLICGTTFTYRPILIRTVLFKHLHADAYQGALSSQIMYQHDY